MSSKGPKLCNPPNGWCYYFEDPCEVLECSAKGDKIDPNDKGVRKAYRINE